MLVFMESLGTENINKLLRKRELQKKKNLYRKKRKKYCRLCTTVSEY